MEKHNTPVSVSMPATDFLRSATGPIAIRMTNDYLFRAILQRSNKALRGLICALLHLEPDQIESAEITNPIELGDSIDEKTFILDVKVILNDSIIINLEMQVINEYNWPERSLSYLCRAFNNLNPGEDYHKVKSVIQVGLLDFTLFPKHPEFYATYQFLNIKNHTVYSDKLRLSVVDLTHMELATEEDQLYHIDKWAALFKATTWEGIKMNIPKNDFILEAIHEAANTACQLMQDENIRLQCEAREDYYRRQRSVQHYIEEQAEQIAVKDSRIADLDLVIAKRDADIRVKESIIAEKDADLIAKDSVIAEKNADLIAKDSVIAEKDADLIAKDSVIADLQAEIERLKQSSTTT